MQFRRLGKFIESPVGKLLMSLLVYRSLRCECKDEYHGEIDTLYVYIYKDREREREERDRFPCLGGLFAGRT